MAKRVVAEKSDREKQLEGEKALLKFLDDRFNAFDVDHQKRAKGWSKQHKQYRGVLDAASSSATKSRLFINRTKVAVRYGVANILDILFPGIDFFDVVGNTELDQKGSEVAKKSMQWVVRVSNFTMEALQYVLQAAIFGSAFGKITQRSTTSMRIDKLPRLDPLGLQVGYRTEQVKTVVKYPVLEVVDIFDMWVDPAAWPSIEREHCSGLFHRIQHRTIGYLRGQERQGIYRNIDEVERAARSKKHDTTDTRRRNVGLPDLDVRDDEVDLYEYWGKVPSDIAQSAGIEVEEGEYETECLITVADMKTIIRAERNKQPNQERMFVSDIWEPAGDKSIFGCGIPENARGSQIALNVTVNTRLDNKAWAIAAPMVVNIDKIEDVADLTARANWIIRGHGAPEDVAKFVTIPDITREAMVEAKNFERIIEEESGMTRETSGEFGSNRTAQGISLAFSAASRPARLIARGFEANLITKGLKKMFMLFVQDLNEELVVRINDDPGAPQYLNIDPLSLALDVDFIPSGTFALQQREAVMDALMSFLDGVSKIPAIQQNINWKFIVQEFHKTLGLKEFDKIWIDAPQIPPMGGPGNAEAGAGPEGGAAGGPPVPDIIKRLAALGRMAQGGGGSGQGTVGGM